MVDDAVCAPAEPVGVLAALLLEGEDAASETAPSTGVGVGSASPTFVKEFGSDVSDGKDNVEADLVAADA